MSRYILILFSVLFVSCRTDTQLFEDVNEVADFKDVSNLTLIQSGEESGFLEPMMEYSIFIVDTLSFSNMENTIQTSEKFDQGLYYLNLELDDYLQQNNLKIINMSKSMISEFHHSATYHLYLFSDRKTFSICKINH